MDCVICSSPILENTWIDLVECCNANIHTTCLDKLDSSCPSCKKDLDKVVLNIIDPNDFGDILDDNANEDDLDVTMQIFHVDEEAEPVDLQFENGNSNEANGDSHSDSSSSDENSSSDSSSSNEDSSSDSSSSDDEIDNSNDLDWDISKVQANSDDSNQQ